MVWVFSTSVNLRCTRLHDIIKTMQSSEHNKTVFFSKVIDYLSLKLNQIELQNNVHEQFVVKTETTGSSCTGISREPPEEFTKDSHIIQRATCESLESSREIIVSHYNSIQCTHTLSAHEGFHAWNFFIIVIRKRKWNSCSCISLVISVCATCRNCVVIKVYPTKKTTEMNCV